MSGRWAVSKRPRTVKGRSHNPSSVIRKRACARLACGCDRCARPWKHPSGPGLALRPSHIASTRCSLATMKRLDSVLNLPDDMRMLDVVRLGLDRADDVRIAVSFTRC